jgi:Trk K+ transport system NAD-binding subunit
VKFIFSQMAFFMAQRSNRRNMRFMLRLTLFALVLILVYSAVFHFLMEWEGRRFSPVTGLYWTLTVMSTLGFGDITFTGDVGRIFSVVVLLSGIVLFMLVMPFTFIRYVYSPWLDAQIKAATPRELPADIGGHVIIVGTDDTALSIALRCRRYDIPYAVLASESAQAVALLDRRFNAVLGDIDAIASYEAMRAERAALVLALHDDLKNTNIAATVREYAKSVPLAGRADSDESTDILRLAGCNHVFRFSGMLGEALARRVFSPEAGSNVIGRFEGFCVAESFARNTPLVGRSLRETDLRKNFSLNVAGIWQGSRYMTARADTVIGDGDVLLLAGTADMLEKYDRFIMPAEGAPALPVLILGGGRVGTAAAATLERRKIPFRIVEQKPACIPKGDERYVLGNAADIAVLRAAGIDETQTVMVTTHNDDLNIYLTIYCRKLRPGIQIISRSNLDRNVASLYSAGAGLVMSQAGLSATAVINLLEPGRAFILTEGLNIFRVVAPPSLAGVSLIESGIRRDTDCNVIAIRNCGNLSVPPDPNAVFRPNDEIILIGTTDAERSFMRRYFR